MKRKIWKRIRIYILAAVFTIMFPTVVTLIFSHKTIQSNKGSGKIIIENNGKTILVDPEEFLTYTLSDALKESENEEYLKLRAVMNRTVIYKKLNKKEGTPADNIPLKYELPEQLKLLWQEQFDHNSELISKCTEATKGKTIKYKGSYIEPMYHKLSAGKTRNGEEVFENSKYKYLQAVNVSIDTNSKDYTKEYTFPMEELTEMFGNSSISVLNRCSSGYVNKIKAGEKYYSGEEFSELLKLNSSNFVVENRDDKIVITTKGIGNGLGISINGAINMAEAGKNYVEIINYYYKNIQIATE